MDQSAAGASDLSKLEQRFVSALIVGVYREATAAATASGCDGRDDVEAHVERSKIFEAMGRALRETQTIWHAAKKQRGLPMKSDVVSCLPGNLAWLVGPQLIAIDRERRKASQASALVAAQAAWTPSLPPPKSEPHPELMTPHIKPEVNRVGLSPAVAAAKAAAKAAAMRAHGHKQIGV